MSLKIFVSFSNYDKSLIEKILQISIFYDGKFASDVT